jgi:hypothetical protein
MSSDPNIHLVLSALRAGHTPYERVLEQFRRATGLAGSQAERQFDLLIRDLVAKKLIDYEARPGTSTEPEFRMLWLRPRGEAMLDADKDGSGRANAP